MCARRFQVSHHQRRTSILPCPELSGFRCVDTTDVSLESTTEAHCADDFHLRNEDTG
ncbi:hypothetical protein BDN67DRAFT_970902 [Paxillus ammoniavirescens]|nr:hypothetical protein BDN67DRAFT_970902 [Paxillus ammoniavirescens]